MIKLGADALPVLGANGVHVIPAGTVRMTFSSYSSAPRNGLFLLRVYGGADPITIDSMHCGRLGKRNRLVWWWSNLSSAPSARTGASGNVRLALARLGFNPEPIVENMRAGKCVRAECALCLGILAASGETAGLALFTRHWPEGKASVLSVLRPAKGARGDRQSVFDWRDGADGNIEWPTTLASRMWPNFYAATRQKPITAFTLTALKEEFGRFGFGSDCLDAVFGDCVKRAVPD